MRLGVFALSIFGAILVSACGLTSATPAAEVPSDIVSFIEASDIEDPIFDQVELFEFSDEVVVFAVDFGEAQDCPSGCFWDVVVGMQSGDTIGWFAENGRAIDESSRLLALDTAAITEAQSTEGVNEAAAMFPSLLDYLLNNADTSEEFLIDHVTSNVRSDQVLFRIREHAQIRRPKVVEAYLEALEQTLLASTENQVDINEFVDAEDRSSNNQAPTLGVPSSIIDFAANSELEAPLLNVIELAAVGESAIFRVANGLSLSANAYGVQASNGIGWLYGDNGSAVGTLQAEFETDDLIIVENVVRPQFDLEEAQVYFITHFARPASPDLDRAEWLRVVLSEFDLPLVVRPDSPILWESPNGSVIVELTLEQLREELTA